MYTVTSPVTDLPFVSTKYQKLLLKLGIETIGDLLTHFPRKYKDTSETSPISTIEEEGEYTIQGQVIKFSSIRIRGGRTIQKGILMDEDGEQISVTWFNQPYLKSALNASNFFLFNGKVKYYKNSLTFFPTSFEKVNEDGEQTHLGRITPQYRLTAGVGIKWLRNRVKYLVDNMDQIPELTTELTTLDSFISEVADEETDLENALASIHFPSSSEEFEKAKDQLSRLELADLSLKLIQKFSIKEEFHAPEIRINKELIQGFIKSLKFELTKDQQTAIATILIDLGSSKPMNRLLQGDVGSGKTLVALISALAVSASKHQTIILVPTTILAKQHFDTFSKLLSGYDIEIGLATSNSKVADPPNILIGTSAVLARKNKLINNPGLVIVDEQHRFGVAQREELLEPFNLSSQAYPHFLDMTATPIPRTMVMSIFGDMQVSNILEKPANRLPINCFTVSPAKQSDSYAWIRNQVVEKGEQVYWIAPLVEESEKLETASAKELYAKLSTEIFPNIKVGLLHGKMKPTDKEEVMKQFSGNEIQILVSTSVIEVGVDVPNATVMVIEGAERFGLAQLHQIRGRVGRGDKQSWCFVFTSDDISDEAKQRLEFFTTTLDGMAISEFDLSRRGPGEVYGTRQSGIPNLKIASFDSIEQIKQSQQLAKHLYSKGVKYVSLFSHQNNIS